MEHDDHKETQDLLGCLSLLLSVCSAGLHVCTKISTAAESHSVDFNVLEQSAPERSFSTTGFMRFSIFLPLSF